MFTGRDTNTRQAQAAFAPVRLYKKKKHKASDSQGLGRLFLVSKLINKKSQLIQHTVSSCYATYKLQKTVELNRAEAQT